MLDAVARLLRRRRDIRAVEIQGHAHRGWGGRVAAYVASRGKARAVAGYLRGKGVASRRLFVLGYGQDRPRCRKATPACHQRNARVELRVVARLPPPAPSGHGRPPAAPRLRVPPGGDTS